MGLNRGGTLCEQVPALGEISAGGEGTAKLLPIGFDHPPIELVAGVTRVGRDQELNDVVIVSDQVSRRHCELLLHNEEIWIQDLGSSNGTFVNTSRVTRHLLRPGDEVGISPAIRFRLVLDDELEAPEGLDLPIDGTATVADVDDDRLSTIGNDDKPDRPSGMALDSTSPCQPPLPGAKPPLLPPGASSAPAKRPPPKAEPMARGSSISVEPPANLAAATDDASLIKQLEKQRNVLAVLYQISLRCLMASDRKEVELLLTNVLKRLIHLNGGYILYRANDIFRAIIVPGLQRPAQSAMRNISKRGLSLTKPAIFDTREDLELLDLSEGSAALVPMLLDGDTVGVICCLSDGHGAYAAEDIDILAQLANVCTAALIQRG